jgi:hypothetical protein
MPIRMCLSMLAVVVVLTSCTSRAILMSDPKSGKTYDCGARSELWAWDVESNPRREETCVRDYQAQGWVRAPQ